MTMKQWNRLVAVANGIEFARCMHKRGERKLRLQAPRDYCGWEANE